jgi:hypothetical protein
LTSGISSVDCHGIALFSSVQSHDGFLKAMSRNVTRNPTNRRWTKVLSWILVPIFRN